MTGRGKYAGVSDIFQGGGSYGSYIWVGDLGDDLPYEPVHCEFPE